MSAKTIYNLGRGKMSTFGGPADEGCLPGDGLALIGPTDLAVWPFSSLFLPTQPDGTTGMARRLNPRAFYLAMRWDEVLKPFGIFYFNSQGLVDSTVVTLLRHALVRLTNPANGATIFAKPADYGPGDGKIIDGQQDPDTGRIADLAPGAASALGLVTDQQVTCELILPEVES